TQAPWSIPKDMWLPGLATLSTSRCLRRTGIIFYLRSLRLGARDREVKREPARRSTCDQTPSFIRATRWHPPHSPSRSPLRDGDFLQVAQPSSCVSPCLRP